MSVNPNNVVEVLAQRITDVVTGEEGEGTGVLSVTGHIFGTVDNTDPANPVVHAATEPAIFGDLAFSDSPVTPPSNTPVVIISVDTTAGDVIINAPGASTGGDTVLVSNATGSGVVDVSAVGGPSTLAVGRSYLGVFSPASSTWIPVTSVSGNLNEVALTSADSPYQVLAGNQWLVCDATGGDITLLAPNSPAADATVFVTVMGGSAHSVTDWNGVILASPSNIASRSSQLRYDGLGNNWLYVALMDNTAASIWPVTEHFDTGSPDRAADGTVYTNGATRRKVTVSYVAGLGVHTGAQSGYLTFTSTQGGVAAGGDQSYGIPQGGTETVAWSVGGQFSFYVDPGATYSVSTVTAGGGSAALSGWLEEQS